MTTPLRIGTRGSPLALWQANHVADRLRPLAAPRPVELILIETSGDVVRDLPLSQIGGEGVFTKEIQRALLANAVDVAVHSLKDLPTTPVVGLTLGAVPERGPAGDVLVSRRHGRFDDLPHGAVVATSSLRRRAQALHRRPDLNLTTIRGNVETRLRKLDEQDLDAIILRKRDWNGWVWGCTSRRYWTCHGCFLRSDRGPSAWNVGPTTRPCWPCWVR